MSVERALAQLHGEVTGVRLQETGTDLERAGCGTQQSVLVTPPVVEAHARIQAHPSVLDPT